MKIEDNKKKIEELKTKGSAERKELKNDYKTQVTYLQQKNDSLKEKLDSYKPEAKNNWTAFKTEFNYDMDELGKALKGLTVDDK